MDIQAARSGVVGPGSIIGICSCGHASSQHKYSQKSCTVCECYRFRQVSTVCYDIEKDLPICPIELAYLQQLFKFSPNRRSGGGHSHAENPKEVSEVIDGLKTLGVKQVGATHFKCPFHQMHGGTGNLVIMPSARLYCFHEELSWSFEDFAVELSRRDLK